MISSLLLRTVTETPDNEMKIRGLPDLKSGAIMADRVPLYFMSHITPPGTILHMGKVVLIDHDRYTHHLESESFYRTLWDTTPADSDLKQSHGGRLVRLSGVLLVDRDGRDRPESDILDDMRRRIEYLASVGAPAECIEPLERYIHGGVDA